METGRELPSNICIEVTELSSNFDFRRPDEAIKSWLQDLVNAHSKSFDMHDIAQLQSII